MENKIELLKIMLIKSPKLKKASELGLDFGKHII